jgi:TolB-like protein
MRSVTVLLLTFVVLASAAGSVSLYMLSGRVSAVEAGLKEASSAGPSDRHETRDPASTRKAIDELAGEVGAAKQELERLKKSAAAKPADSGPPVSPRSVAVLPFQNLYPKTTGEAAKLADSIPEDVTARLSKIADLEVVSASVIASHKKGDFPWSSPQEAGRQLKAANVVTGKITLERGYVIIFVELVLAETGKTLWSERISQYDEFDNVVAINKFLDGLAKQITEEVETKLKGAKEKPK